MITKNCRILTVLIALVCGYTVHAQIYPDGTPILNNFTLKDINGNTVDAFTQLNSGKHLVLDFAKTWCAPCWDIHETHILDHYNDSFGTNGSLSQDASVWLLECDVATDSIDLAPWTVGTNYHIQDFATEAEYAAVEDNFAMPGFAVGYARIHVVCANKKFYMMNYQSMMALTSANELRDFINSKCGLQPLSASQIFAKGFSFDVAPNPANNNTSLIVDLESRELVSYTIADMFGHTITNSQPSWLTSGINKIGISTSNLAAGIYIVTINVGGNFSKIKLVLNK
jgi:hypothetical protein